VITDKEIGPQGGRLLNRALQRGLQNDLSFDGVGEAVERQFQEIMNAPQSEQQKIAGAHLTAEFERKRVSAMSAYAAQKSTEARSMISGR
jgi:hypothetical protein